MDVAGIIATFRRDMVDQAEPYFWSDDDVVAYLNSAVQEACERALLIEDSRTAAVCELVLIPGQSTYALHPSVLRIKRLTFRGRPLDETSVEALDAGWHGWELRQGEPRGFIFEQEGGTATPARLRLVPTPSQAEAVALTVYRGPLTQLSAGSLSAHPEIPERFHERLMPWLYRCAKLKPDAETAGPSEAAQHEAEFERAFGARPDANVQRKRRDRRPRLVRFEW